MFDPLDEFAGNVCICGSRNLEWLHGICNNKYEFCEDCIIHNDHTCYINLRCKNCDHELDTFWYW